MKFVLNQDALLREIGEGAFEGCCVRDFSITENLFAEKCDFTGIFHIGNNYNNNYILESGLLMSVDKKTLYGVFLENESVCIPSPVECIRPRAFHSKLEKLSFEHGSSRRAINPEAFGDCYIEKLVLSDSFDDISRISRKFVGNIEFEIGNPNFDCFDDDGNIFIVSTDSRILWKCLGNFREITIPCCVESIGRHCFYEDCFLETVSFEEGSELRELGEEVFCRSSIVSIAESVLIPKSVKVIEENCFYGCKDLISLEFEEGSELEIVGSGAFNKTSLVSIEFLRNLRQLGKCFDYCESLSEVMFHEDCPLEEIPEFYRVNITLHVPSNVLQIHGTTLKSAKEVLVSEKNPHLGVSSRCLYLRSGELLGQIGDSKSIVIPKEVTSIPERVFEYSDIESVTFEDGSLLTEIGKCAFSYCESLSIEHFRMFRKFMFRKEACI